MRDADKAAAARHAHCSNAGAYVLSRKIDGHFIKPSYENDDSIWKLHASFAWTLPLFSLLITCFAFPPMAKAVVPPPDGGYPGFNTAEGQNALFSLTSGLANTGVGWDSLFSNTDGGYNTAVGAGTLLCNIGDQGAFQGVDNTAVGAGRFYSTLPAPATQPLERPLF